MTLGEALDFATKHAEGIALAGATIVIGGAKAGKWILKKADKLKYIRALNSEKELDRILKYYNQLLLSDCLRIWQIHNGNVSIGNVSLMKISCTHEVVRAGYLPTINSNKDLYINGMLPWIGPIIDGYERVVKNADTEVLDVGTKQFLERNGAKAIFAVPLTKDGLVIGYASALYKRQVNMDEIINPEHKLTMFNDIFRKMYSLKGVLEKELNG